MLLRVGVAVCVSLGVVAVLFLGYNAVTRDDGTLYPFSLSFERVVYGQQSKIIFSRERIVDLKPKELTKRTGDDEDSIGKDTNTKKKKNGKTNQEEETCDVNPAPKGVYVKGHGPCITQFPHQPAALGGMDDCWRLAFAVQQWGQPKNPSKAEYGDDWEATARAYPWTARQAKQIVKDFNTKTELPVSSEWSPDHPYVRLCVPTACGLSKKSGCELQKTDFLMHLNPNTKDIDNITHLFYKGFVRNGHLMLPNAGLTAH